MMRIGTKVIRAGLAPAAQGESFLAGVTFAGTYHASGEISASPYTYGRYHNPTWTQFERALNELEGGIAFVLADQARAEQFLQSCKLIIEATSFGGVHTTAERRARWGGDEIPAGFIRLSVGCEDSQDLVDDVARALDVV